MNKEMNEFSLKQSNAGKFGVDLRALKHRYTRLIEASSCWLWEHALGDGLLYLSENFETQTGIDRQFALTLGFEKLLAEPGRSAIHQLMSDRVAFRNRLFQLNVGASSSWIRLSGTPIFDRAGRYVGYEGYGENITNLILQDELLRDALLHAEEEERIKREFLSNLNHELRTPLAGVMGALDLLLLDDHGTAVEELADMGKKCADQLNELISDLLFLSAFTSRQLKIVLSEFSPEDLLRQVVEKKRGQASAKEIAVDFELIGEVSEMMVSDVSLLGSLLEHLVDNSLKFAQQGTILINIRFDAKANEWTFRLEDEGPGIPANILNNPGALLVQGDSAATRNHHGLGIGLSLIREIVSALDGSLFMANKMTCGAVFEIKIPQKIK